MFSVMLIVALGSTTAEHGATLFQGIPQARSSASGPEAAPQVRNRRDCLQAFDKGSPLGLTVAVSL